jgi:gamma-glutamylcyclotransferase (GGCT)/AIG2-like uncharacterized protein YtfP
MPNHLFVYGTLMRGFENAFAKQLHQIGTCQGLGYFAGQLFDLGYYPGATLLGSSTHKVWGEIWELPEAHPIMAQLDGYEGVADAVPEYTRERVQVQTTDGVSIECWVYLYVLSTQVYPLIPHGNYQQWLSDKA